MTTRSGNRVNPKRRMAKRLKRPPSTIHLKSKCDQCGAANNLVIHSSKGGLTFNGEIQG